MVAFLMFLLIIAVICILCYSRADVVAVYTRNNLAWTGVRAFQDGSVKLNLRNGKTTVQFKNDARGNVGYSIYLYEEKESSNNVRLSTKNMSEINKNEYPGSLKGYDIKYAYRGYVEGNGKKFFEIKSTGNEELRLLMIIEDNNSYPKEEKSIPTMANIKFNAEVLLDGKYPRGDNYSFYLKNGAGEVIESVSNDDGYISFSNIALKEKGTYIYYILQIEGKDKETVYDKSVYKITVELKAKNDVKVFYEKDGTPRETLPRFSNYKKNKDILDRENVVEYPNNEKKSTERTNYLLISTITIGILICIFYIMMGKKKG